MHIPTSLSLIGALQLALFFSGSCVHAAELEGPLGGKTPQVIQQLEAWLDELPDGFPCTGPHYDARYELPAKLEVLRGNLFSLKNDLPMTIFWLEGVAEDKAALAIAYESTDQRLVDIHAGLTDLVALIERTPCSAPVSATATLGEVLKAQEEAKARRASATPADAQAGIRQVKQLEPLLVRVEEQLTRVTDSAYEVSMQAYGDAQIQQPTPPSAHERSEPTWASRRVARIGSATSKAWIVQNQSSAPTQTH